MSMREDLLEFEKLGYVELTNTPSATITVELLCAGALLSSYFWSVWVPRYLQCCSLKVAVMSHLTHLMFRVVAIALKAPVSDAYESIHR